MILLIELIKCQVSNAKILGNPRNFFKEGVLVFKWAMNRTKAEAPKGEKRHEPAWE